MIILIQRIIHIFNEMIILIQRIIYIFNETIILIQRSIYIFNERIVFIQRIIYIFNQLFMYSTVNQYFLHVQRFRIFLSGLQKSKDNKLCAEILKLVSKIF